MIIVKSFGDNITIYLYKVEIFLSPLIFANHVAVLLLS